MQPLLALGLMLLVEISPDDRPTVTQDQTDEIVPLIRELGAPEFVKREAATHALWRIGLAAEKQLQEAAASSDREVVARATLILERFRYGIFPDTGPEIVALIERYRTGDEAARRDAIAQLIAAGQIETIKRFIRLAESGVMRDQVCEWVLGRFDQTIRPLIESDREEMARDLLLVAANEPEDYAVCARLLSLRDEVDEAVQILSAELTTEPSERVRALLVTLLRTQGDFERALSVAGELEDSYEPQRNLYISERRWSELSDWLVNTKAEPTDERIAVERARMESLGFAAMAHHLADQPERRDAVLAEINEMTTDNPTLLLFAAEAMFGVDRYDDAIQLLTRRDQADGFRILVGQHRYDEAFESLTRKHQAQTIDEWLAAVIVEDNLKHPDGRIQLYLSVDVVAQMNSLGLKERASNHIDRLAEVAMLDTNPQLDLLRETCRRLIEAGMEDRAYGYMRTAFTETRMKSSPAQQSDFGIRCVTPRDYVLGTYWWRALADEYPETIDRLKAVRRLLALPVHSEEDREFVRNRLAAEVKRLESVDVTRRQREQSMFADTCRRLGERELAYEHYQLAFNMNDHVSAIRLGDLYREDEKWMEAANWYDSAWSNSPTQTEALYLAGYCRLQAGNAETGQQQCDLAVRISLTSLRMLQLAEAIRQRGQEDTAKRWYEWMMQTSEPMGQAYSDACNRFGNIVYASDSVQAADAWEQVFIGVQKQERNFVNLSGYLSMAHLIHHARATELLANNDADGAMKLVTLCQQAQPGNTDLVEEFVPGFAEKGRADYSEQVFAAMRDMHLGILEKYPNSALHHNNLAWGSARCHRDLPDALEHAKRAVEIDPNSSNYLDTLAEVNFRLGNVDEAIELVKRCLEIAPEKPHYHEQLERFQKAQSEPSTTEG